MHKHLRSVLLPIALCCVASSFAAAQQDLMTPVDDPSPAARAWDLREKLTNPSVVRSRFVRVATTQLRRGAFSADLFGTLTTIDIERSDSVLGYREFEGTVRGRSGHVHLAVAPDGVCAGTFHLGDGSYALSYAASADIHVLQEIDESKHPQCQCLGAQPGKPVPNPGLPAGGTDTNLDVLVAYTPRARSTAGGKSAIESRIVNAIGQANTTNKSSNVAVIFRLVLMVETNYTENGSTQDLSRFRSTSDGYMDEVHKLRDTYGADLMHLITQPTRAQYCGVAYLMRSNSTGFNTSSFAVTLRQCMTNNVVAHELGHNIGCHHDKKNAGSAIYPYAYGFRTSDNKYRTTMAYSPGTRVLRWSGPKVKYSTYTMGSASEDNARTITNTKGTVARFRATKLLEWCELSGGIAGQNGVPRIVGDGTINKVRPISITIDRYRPNANGLLVLGATGVNVPFLGGLLVPSPDVLAGITGNGTPIKIDGNALANLPKGAAIWFQAMFRDAAAVQGVSASNGFKVVVP